MRSNGVGISARDFSRRKSAGKPRKDQRFFSRTAGRTRVENMRRPNMRGGYRL